MDDSVELQFYINGIPLGKNDPREQVIINNISIVDERSSEPVKPILRDFDELTCTPNANTGLETDSSDEAPCESFCEPVVVTEDGSVFSANIDIANDGNLYVTKDDIIYEIDTILHYDEWNALVSSCADHQMVSTATNESTDEEGNCILVPNDDIPEGHFRDPGHSYTGEKTNPYNPCNTSFGDMNIVSDCRPPKGTQNQEVDDNFENDLDNPSSQDEKDYINSNTGNGFQTSDPIENYLSSKAKILYSDKPHQCEICGNTFRQSSHLTEHKRIHTGEKPFKCRICDKSFTTSRRRKQHERIHTGEKPYECEICGRSFSQSSHLHSHERTHTGEKPYQCQKCSKCFAIRSNMIRHENKSCKGVANI